MKSYVVMADNREKIICVSDDLRLARGAGWDWLKSNIIPITGRIFWRIWTTKAKTTCGMICSLGPAGKISTWKLSRWRGCNPSPP